MAQVTSLKDVQAHLRLTNAKTTLEHYIKSVPESVRVGGRIIGCRAVQKRQRIEPKRPNQSPRLTVID